MGINNLQMCIQIIMYIFTYSCARSITTPPISRIAITHRNIIVYIHNFIRYRNIFNKLKKACKQTYYSQKLSLYKNDIKKTWKILNEVIGKHNDKSNISEIFKSGNDTISDPIQISNQFCKYFSEIGSKFASQIPVPRNQYNHYLKDTNNHNSLFMIPTDAES